MDDEPLVARRPQRSAERAGESPLRCSFCNKSQKDVLKLIAGPTVYICDECVDICNEILAEDKLPKGRPLKQATALLREATNNLASAAHLRGASDPSGAFAAVRGAALGALRALVLLAFGELPPTADPREVTYRALLEYEACRRCLHETDRHHILTRVTLEGAGEDWPGFDFAIEAARELIAFAKVEIEKKQVEST